jgi:hypothetical protein
MEAAKNKIKCTMEANATTRADINGLIHIIHRFRKNNDIIEIIFSDGGMPDKHFLTDDQLISVYQLWDKTHNTTFIHDYVLSLNKGIDS